MGGIKRRRSTSAAASPSTSARTSPASALGNYLVSRGALSPGELAMALAMMPHYGGKLWRHAGRPRPAEAAREVFRHLTYQVRQKLIDVCTWTKGDCAWYDGAQRAHGVPLDLNPFEVLGAGAMAMHDAAITHWMMERAASTVGARGRVRRSTSSGSRSRGLPTLYGRVDGDRTVGQLITESLDPTAQRRTAGCSSCSSSASW
ncbi:MAG: hypothetical protein HS111_12390 [Kofleriaceae bacterium]|nr:hypothetical protein [Kofleriaceae bacterium]